MRNDIFQPYNKLVVISRGYSDKGCLKVNILDTYDGKRDILHEDEFYKLQPLLDLSSCEAEEVRIANCCNSKNNAVYDRLIETYVANNYKAVHFITVTDESIITAKMLGLEDKIELDNGCKYSLFFELDAQEKILYLYSDAYLLKLEDLF